MGQEADGGTNRRNNEDKYALSKAVKKVFDVSDGLLGNKEYVEARAILGELLTDEPGNPMVLNYTGVVYMYEEKLEEAETCFRRILEKHDDFLLAYVNLSIVLARLKRFEESDEIIGKIIENAPENPMTWATIAAYYGEIVEYETAVKFNLIALSAHPDFLRAAFNLACNFCKMGNSEEALEYLDKALADPVIFQVMLDNEDLDPIRNMPEFRDIVKKYREIHSDS